MKNLFRILTCIALAATSLRAQTNGNKAATSGLPPLIDRELIFGNPEIVNPELSPDGRFLAFEKPWKNTRKDRKSTRLNSSHLGISYAVFCLKKKKKKTKRNFLQI